MAYVASRKGGRWEVRESVSTSAGPRSRTLAGFGILTPDVVAHARKRARTPITAAAIRRAARRAGAPVAEADADAAAGVLLRELESGRRPRRSLARLLAGALAGSGSPTDAERAVAPWVGATLEQRAEALRDLLLLSDALPARDRTALAFPGVAPVRR